MYALIKNGSVAQYPYTVTDLRLANPNTSFPVSPSDQSLKPFDLLRVRPQLAPLVPPHQRAVEAAPTLQNGEWVQSWVVRDKSLDEASAEAEAVRAERNAKLSACDWTQVADAPVNKAAWAAYRQALRDVTSQPGFPFSVSWPNDPV